MAKKKSILQRAPTAQVTPERAARLYRLLTLLARKPQNRNVLARALKLGIRGFYRDLETLRIANIDVPLANGRYKLSGKLDDAVARLPFPDPGLTLGDALQLARGRSKAHQTLKKLIEQIMKKSG